MEMKTRTVPEPCPQCGGSGRVITVRNDLEDYPPYARMLCNVGFHRDRCKLCRGHGEATKKPEPVARGWL